MTFNSFIKNIKWRFAKLFYSIDAQKWQNVLFVNEDFQKGNNNNFKYQSVLTGSIQNPYDIK